MLGYTQAFASVNKLNLSYTIDNLCAFRPKHQDTIQIAILLYVQLDIFMQARISHARGILLGTLRFTTRLHNKRYFYRRQQP